MPGPAPNPNARRRNARPNYTQLPAGGYRGDTPKWPLPEPTEREMQAWDELWRTPQAAAWAQMELARPVARYVRALAVAEEHGATAFMLSEVRQLEATLGLTPMAMLRLRWEVVTDELAEQRTPAAKKGSQRLRAVE